MRVAVLLLLLPAAVGAQKYQLVATTPGMSGTLGGTGQGHPITMRKAMSDVVMTKSDTAKLIRLVVTATKVDEIVMDSSAEAAAMLARRPAPASTALQTPITYEILFKSGKPYSLTTTRVLPANAPADAPAPKPVVLVLDSLNPSMNLLARLPGLALLIPNHALDGASFTDRYPSHTAGSPLTATVMGSGNTITLPPVDVTDTSTIVWTRNGDAAAGDFKQHIVRKSETTSGETNATGAPKVTFDAKGDVQSASWSVSSSSTSVRAADGSVSLSVSSSSYVISRVN